MNAQEVSPKQPYFIWDLSADSLDLRWFKFTPEIKYYDYLYLNQAHNTIREEADQIFLQIMLSDNVNPIIAYLFYFCVRLMGKFKWRG